MSNHDFIPAKDGDFDDWQNNLVTVLTSKLGTYGILITNTDYVALLAFQTDWVSKYAIGRKAANPTHPQVIAKQNSRHAYERALRVFNSRYLAFNPAVTNDEKALLRTTIPDAIRTSTARIAYQPDIKIEEIGHLFQVLHFQDPHSTGRALPDGAVSMLVFRAILPAASGAMPQESDFHYAGKTGTFSFTANFNLTDVDKVAYYYAQYQNVHGDDSPKSLIVNAPIA